MPEGGSIAGRKLIGEGREAEIYEWDDGTVLRLLRRGIDPARVEGEAAAMRAAGGGGVDVPRVRDTITVDGRAGLVMDRVDGPDLITLMGRRPWTIPRAARIVGMAQARMHEVVAPPDLDDLRSHARFKIEAAPNLPSDLAEFALATLDSLPDGDRVCHGDLHPGNVIMASDGPVIIDWFDAARGSHIADIARTSLLMSTRAHGPNGPGHLPGAGPGMLDRVHDSYLDAITELVAVEPDDVRRWEAVIAVARVAEGIATDALVAIWGERRSASLRTGAVP